MGLLKKKNKDEEPESNQDISESPKDKKRKSDKSIKPRSPKSTGPKLFIRVIFWIFILFVLIRGISSVVRGPQVIQEVNVIGDSSPSISDSIKGFAIDFATEYFTWSTNGVNNRIERLSKFIENLDEDAGLKSYQVSGESKVLSVEVYDTTQIDDTHYDITTLIRREVALKNAETAPTDSVEDVPAIQVKTQSKVIQKTYMIVPVTMTSDGPLIQEYPRFVVEQQKGSKAIETTDELLSDGKMIERATELADSFLRTYFEGNVTQLKYFYADDSSAPKSLVKSEFSLSKVAQVQIYKATNKDTGAPYLRIEASVLVTNEFGETFTNQWTLNAVDTDQKLYVISVGYPEIKKVIPLKSETITPVPTNPAP
ncbi:conjugal transfer protein (plasmid) [Paenibacillus sonchi]|uniref:Conjugal transfer protein n=1 Tax=Paenibacillus sonchi TaxID=373687 RepID=A0A974PJA4_9BACL|nr:conjugal transfer protein [Paenibacillus sonchi]QQZ64628.1 conjugal transfer protein [Paenibacillus sonchi]